jgi:alkylation response protein AidB-like acyl-CoA dehydrogenase
MRLSCLCYAAVLAGLTVPPAGQTPVPPDTASPYGIRLPTPEVAENAPPATFLNAARLAIAAGREGEAQEALERAESRALDRSVRPSRAGASSRQPLAARIAEARAALATGDRMQALQRID